VRDRELIVVGRLVSDKGVDVLIEALAHLRAQGLAPRLTVVGEGPESARLKALVFDRGVKAQVQFVGVQTGGALARLLNQHQILVVPSRWQEPFGLVALEGIACGCVAVGSAGGGLPEAIGPCGVTFPNGNSARLAEALADLLRHPVARAGYRASAPAHLRPHERQRVAQGLLGVLENAARRRVNPFEMLPRRPAPPLQRAA
jgi:glycogen synthase